MFDARPNLANKGTGTGLSGWLEHPSSSGPTATNQHIHAVSSVVDNQLSPSKGRIGKVVMDRINVFRQERLSKLRPWGGEFLKLQQFSIPEGMGAVQSRFTNNLGYFQSNYLVVVLLLFFYCLVTNLFMALLIAALIAGFIYINNLPPDYNLQVAGMALTRRNLSIALIIAGIFIFLFTGVSSALFWLVGLSALVIGAHAIFHEVVLESDFAQQQA